MPKAAVYENHCAKLRQDNIRLARKVLAVKSESITHRMQKRPNSHLGFSVAVCQDIFLVHLREGPVVYRIEIDKRRNH